jgi:gamma-glutamyltranspeptidase/glutathione hydrolase
MRDFQRPGRSPVLAGNGMAATSHPLASAVAVDVLRGGGNAVDAAVAASAVLTVVEPHMTGIGGDCFVILAEPDGSVHGLNGSGRAPAAATAAAYRARGLTGIPEFGPLSITVPGAIKAWEVLVSRFGSRELGSLLAPAIRYAVEGFPVHARVAWDWGRQVDALAADEGGAMHYLVDGAAPRAGTRHRQPALAETLRAIASRGARAFYEGPIAAEMAATVQAKGGYLAEEDLAAVSADWVTPISTRYRGHDVLEIPPNGQGITALIMLNLMRELGVERPPVDSAERYHLEIEAGRIAYSVLHSEVSDPATMKVAVESVLSDTYTRGIAGQFDPQRRNPAVAFPKNPSSDTVYLSVVDRDRRAISFINSTYDAFGSRVVTPVSGIALQNRGACFNLIEGHPNEIGPRKRPLHTIIPAMAMKDGRAYASFGVMGGDFQPMGHAHVFANLVDFGMDPQEAIDHPRLFWGEDGVLDAEAGISSQVRAGLVARGHAVRDAERPHGGGQMIVIDAANGFLVGGSDPRKDGCALGW